MSFTDPGFLFNNRTTDQEREAERRRQEGLRARVQGCYRAATWLVVLTLLYVPLPLGLEVWHWQVVGAVAAVIFILAVRMALLGAVKLALLSVLFAAVILPAWVQLHPAVLRVVWQQVEVIRQDWQRVL